MSKNNNEIKNSFLSFIGSENKDNVEFFHDDGEITQIRFNLTESNPQILNKKLIISKSHFKNFVTLFHERHFNKNGRKIIEYFSDNVLDFYFVTEKTMDYRITEGFSPDGKMFSREKIEFDNQGKPITEEQLIYNADGTKTDYRINL
jgi:hypothetical protein